MSTDKKAHNDQQHEQAHKLDQNIEWDNGEATYGHSITESPFKRKNIPTPSHLAKVDQADGDVNENLKNLNFANDEDPANRNSNNEKGLGGKDL